MSTLFQVNTRFRRMNPKFDLSEFTRTDELAAVGVEATEASIERIRTTLADLDKQLFSARSSNERA